MEAAAKIEAAIAANVLNIPSPDNRPPILFREYTADWMEGHVRTNLKASTQQAYRILLDKHILPAFRNKPLGEISRNEIKALCFKKAESGLAGRSVHYIARTMSAIFNQAIEDGIISSNPGPGPGDTSRSRTGGESSDFWPPPRDGYSSIQPRSPRRSSTLSS